MTDVTGPEGARAARVIVPCAELDPTLSFFTERLGFRVEAIYPADDPSVVVVSGYGVRLQLDRGAEGPPGALRLLCRGLENAAVLVAPNGTRVELVDEDPPLVVPPVERKLVVSDNGDGSRWGTGRAGMLYRDLIPGRLGGSFIASHIRIPDGGPVPDYVHFHKIRFQMIYCYKGWVRVVYEDQGPPFVLEAGDCVLQPPRIRHRVLECSPGMEVVEIGCPANHETFADHELELPTSRLDPGRDFGGQRFVRHRAASAAWEPFRLEGFECRDVGIAAATDGLAGVRIARSTGTPPRASWRHDAEFLFTFILEGALSLERDDGTTRPLEAGSAFVLPAGETSAFADCSADLELLEVSLPATFETTRR
jgi:quercetin dioxygenase-like cupin family protein